MSLFKKLLQLLNAEKSSNSIGGKNTNYRHVAFRFDKLTGFFLNFAWLDCYSILIYQQTLKITTSIRSATKIYKASLTNSIKD